MKHKIINGKAPIGSKYIDELDEALYGLTDEQKLDLIDSVMPKIDACLGIPIITGTVGGVDKFDGIDIISIETNEIVCQVYDGLASHISQMDMHIVKANAELIADAFNTTNESGLTPSQLYKQNQELLYALKELVYELTGEQECEDELEKGLGITLAMRVRQAQQAINNAKTKKRNSRT